MFLFPPYSLSSGLLGGEVYSYFRDPPELLPDEDYRDTPLQAVEAFTVAAWVGVALTTLRREASRRQRRVAFWSGMIAAALLGEGLISLNMVLGGPPWPILAGMGLLTLVGVLLKPE